MPIYTSDTCHPIVKLFRNCYLLLCFSCIQQSAPEVDVDILVIRVTSNDADNLKLQVANNKEALHDMLLGLKERLPAITFTLESFADRFEIITPILTSGERIDEAFNAVCHHVLQLSFFFRDTVAQCKKTVQVFLDAAIEFLKETQLKLPGYEEITTLPLLLLKQITNAIASILEQAIQMIIENVESWR